MSGSVSKRPKAATCEDWDENTQSTLPGSKTSAAVAVNRAQSSDSKPPSRSFKHSNEGSDSGYSSRAATVATSSSMSSDRRKPSDLKLDPVFTERERTPYSYSAKTTESDRQEKKEKSSKPDQKTAKQKTRQPPGEYGIYDEFGYQVEITPPSPRAVRVPSTKVQEEDASRPPQRRRPSSTQPRPTSMYVGAPPVQPLYSPLYAYTTAWEHPSTPTYSYAASPYQYSAPPPPPPPQHYVAPAYYEQWPDYEETPPPTAHRRMSSYGRESPKLERKPSKTTNSYEKPVVREKRTATVSSKSAKNVEDSLAMPPPPRPQPAQVTSHRPSTSRSQTYHDGSSSSRRHSQISENGTSPRDPPPSPSRPPSSWRGQNAAESADRPSMPTGKSRSYTQGSDRVESTAVVRRESAPRRTTTSSVPHEQQEAEAEAYQKRRGSMFADNLTAENLKRYTSRSQDKADAVSTTSRRSHHSSKESATGRERSTTGSRGSKTNININGINVSIPDGIRENSAQPVKIDLGNICISMGGKDKENIDVRREQKRLERAPSVASKASRQSATSGSGVSSSDPRRPKEIEAPPKQSSKESSRRSSQAEERDIVPVSVQSSRHGSRAGSKVRKSVDYTTRPEYYYRDEPTVYGA